MKKINKPVLNAPRFRPRSMTVLTMQTLKEFVKKYPEYKNLKLSEFKSIIQTFNGNLCQGIIDNRNGIELPDGLGNIFMGSCPSPKESFDYKASAEHGVRVGHGNWDSDNRLLKIFYTNFNAKYPFHNKQVWGFKAVKQFRKQASEAFRTNHTLYVEVPPEQKISALFDRHRKKEHRKNMKPVIPEGYNEFKM